MRVEAIVSAIGQQWKLAVALALLAVLAMSLAGALSRMARRGAKKASSGGTSAMLPPWEMYPDLPQGDLGWRMGYGEAYLDEFLEWWRSIPLADRREYGRRNRPPKDWIGFYSDMEAI